jgi:Fe-S-cluster containining protein
MGIGRDKGQARGSIALSLVSQPSQTFECQRCGQCCFGPSRRYGIKIFYQEVRAIQEHLKGLLCTEKFEEYAWDYLTFFGRPESIGDKAFLETFKESLRDFFYSVSQSSSDREKLYVEYYVLKTYRDSGRCIFYNPLARSCLIHEVKPHTCRLYPFYAEINLEKGYIRVRAYPGEPCPGLGSGKASDVFELGSRAIEFTGCLRSHYSKLAELMEPHDPEKAKAIAEFYGEKLKYRLRNQEEALRQYEKIASRRKYEGIEARDLFLEKGLVEGCEEYRKRLKRG